MAKLGLGAGQAGSPYGTSWLSNSIKGEAGIFDNIIKVHPFSADLLWSRHVMRPMIAPCRLIFLISLILSGCQVAMLREKTNEQAQTVTDLNYQEVLDNLALAVSHPDVLPYFSAAATGQISLTRTYTGSYTPNLDLITSAGTYLGRYLVDKQSAMLQGSQAVLNAWTPAVTLDPDRLALMGYAYQIETGWITDEAIGKLLGFYGYPRSIKKVGDKEVNDLAADLDKLRKHGIYSGWCCVNDNNHVPKDACYVGHYCKTYISVNKDHVRDLSNFTKVILDFATLAANAPPLAPKSNELTRKIQKGFEDVKTYKQLKDEAGKVLDPNVPAQKTILANLETVYDRKVQVLAIDVAKQGSQGPETEGIPEPFPLRPRLQLYLPYPIPPSSQ
jgi:hypothetical protein